MAATKVTKAGTLILHNGKWRANGTLIEQASTSDVCDRCIAYTYTSKKCPGHCYMASKGSNFETFFSYMQHCYKHRNRHTQSSQQSTKGS